MPRHYKLDENGKQRLRPGPLPNEYYMAQYANPAEPKYKVAMEVYRRRGQVVTAKYAAGKATEWDNNPWKKETMESLFRHEVVRPALRKAADWLADLHRRGTKAEQAMDLSVAVTALKVEADHMPPEDMPKKQAAPAGGDTFNFNGPNPFSGWSLEELAAWRDEHRARLVEAKVVHTDGS